jgi:formylglycine-generating enzyme required for sulfatase activity
MIGNVWEWTSDAYAPSHRDGGAPAMSSTPAPTRVIKGGSYLCAENYCRRYRAAARHAQDVSIGANHIGLRLVYDDPPP